MPALNHHRIEGVFDMGGVISFVAYSAPQHFARAPEFAIDADCLFGSL
jgi:hypothetical protein